MDLESLKKAIVTNVYHIDSSKKIALHKHNTMDEIFYCVAEAAYGVFGKQRNSFVCWRSFYCKSRRNAFFKD